MAHLLIPEFGHCRVHTGGPCKRRMGISDVTVKQSKGLQVNSLCLWLRSLAVKAVLLFEDSYTPAAFLPAGELEVTTAHSKMPFTLINL